MMTRACNNVFKFEQLADETLSPFFNDDGKLLAAIQALTIYSILLSGEEYRCPRCRWRFCLFCSWVTSNENSILPESVLKFHFY